MEGASSSGGVVQPVEASVSRLYLVEVPAPCPSAPLSFEALCRSLLERIIFEEEGPGNPLVLNETHVIRLFRRMSETLRVPWNTILETTRQGDCVLDARLHAMLADIWETRVSRNVSLDEQNCYERVMGRDHVRHSDLQKLAGTLARVAEPKRVWTFFGVDGYLGDDPKRYVDHLRYADDTWRGRHVSAVRGVLYRYLDHPHMVHDALENLFSPEKKEGEGLLDNAAREEYVRAVGGHGVVRQIGEWRTEQKEKRKRNEAGGETSRLKRKGREDDNDERKRKKEEDEENHRRRHHHHREVVSLPKRKGGEEEEDEEEDEEEEEEEVVAAPTAKRPKTLSLVENFDNAPFVPPTPTGTQPSFSFGAAATSKPRKRKSTTPTKGMVMSQLF